MAEQTGLCECGCGHSTTVAERDNASLGWIAGEPKRFRNGHNRRKSGRYVEADTGYRTPCWIWQLTKNALGYGRCAEGKNMVFAHRKYYEDRCGKIPSGKQLDHLCRVPSCVNPDHLEAVTPRENVRRGALTKLSPESVRRIRDSDEKQHVLARRYGVTQGHISRIKTRRSWCDL